MQPITVAGAFASIGVPAAVTYFVAKGGDPKKTYRRALLVTGIPALTVYFLMALYSGVVEQAQDIDRGILLIAWLAILLSAVVQVRRGMWQGCAGWLRLDTERASYALLRFAAVVTVALIGLQLAAPYAYASLGAFVVAAMVLWVPHGPSPVEEQKDVSVVEIRAYAGAAAFGTIATVANNRLDQVLFPAAGSSAELGYYAVAVTVAEVPLVFGVLAARNVLTLASKGASLGGMFRSVRLYVIGTLGGSICLAAVATWALPLVFGREFQPAVGAAVLLAFGTIFTAAALGLVSVLSGWGRPGLGSVVPLSGLVVTLVGFAVNWGEVTSLYAGVVAAMSQAVACLCGIVIVYRLRRDKGGLLG
jgi:O-antigen/teichoic acid export membrane protein